MAREEHDDLVLWPVLDPLGDLVECFFDTLLIDLRIGEDGSQSRLACGVKAPGLQHFAETIGVSHGIAQPTALVVADAQGDDMEPAGLHRAIVGDFDLVGTAVERAIPAGHRIEPVGPLEQAYPDGELGWARAFWKARRWGSAGRCGRAGRLSSRPLPAKR